MVVEKARSICVCAAGFALAAQPPGADAHARSAVSIQSQSGFFGFTDQPVDITSDPFDFAGTDYQRFESLEGLRILVGIFDGDTGRGPGNFDRGDLTLALDGIDTGLVLNGFQNNLLVWRSRRLGSIDPQLSADLLAALQDDGQLQPTIVDATPGDNFIWLPSATFSSIRLIGTFAPSVAPSPAALGVGALGGLALLGQRRRKD